MRNQAQVVIIGGGIVGCSALYHLAKLGVTDTLLIERDELTSGSTWHAAGNCPTFSTNWNIVKFQRYGNGLYERLAAEVDYPINYHVTGSVRLAHSQDRMDEFKHVIGMARAQGLEFELMTPAELKNIYPFLELHDLVGGLWDPYDGDIDPSQVTQAFAKGARAAGAEVARFTKVTAIQHRPSGEWEIATDKGNIVCETVINAAGYRGGEIAAMVGQYLPIVSMSHQYLLTEAIPELEQRSEPLPLLRDPDISYYLRQERSGLILGPYEKAATPHWLEGIPESFAYQLYPDDLDRLEWYIEQAIGRVPILGSVGVQKVINGPIPYAPDGNPYVGPAHDLPNFYHCCCFSFGICQGGGAGKSIAEYVVDGDPEWDLWVFDPRRYSGYANRKYVVDKAIELYSHEYAIAYPFEERPAGRPARTTPVYGLLKAKGAMFGARGGWERATWFPRALDAREQALSFHRTNWFEAVAEECHAVQNRVGILDLGGFSRYSVTGPGAENWLDHMIAGRLPRQGRISLSYMLNRRGGIVCEFTIAKLGPECFLLISAAAGEWHDEDWLRRYLPTDGSVEIQPRTESFMTLVLAGPESREVLAKVTSTDLSNQAFPWLSWREIDIGFTKLLAMRVNYVGELGWELHIPSAYHASVYEALWQAGQAFDIRDFGMYAMESLRLEKCYRSWKADLTHEYTPAMASLDRFVDLNKTDFIGRDALLAEREAGVKERLVPLLVEAKSADTPACASVLLGDDRVGLVTSGGFGHRINRSIALAYVRTDLARPGTRLELEILGERVAAEVAREPLYDHNNSRLRA